MIRAIGELYQIYDEELPGYEFGYMVTPDEDTGLPDDYQGFFPEFYFKYDEIKSFLNSRKMDLPKQFEINEATPSDIVVSKNGAIEDSEDIKMASMEQDKPLRTREKNNLHAIIGGLLVTIIKARKNNQTSVGYELISLFKGTEPFSKRNLEKVFSESKDALKDKGFEFDELKTISDEVNHD